MARLDLSLPHWLCIGWYCFAYAVDSLNFLWEWGSGRGGKALRCFPHWN